ncbi:MAG: hypothetical protein SNJ74_03350 [Fimbriimonadaceae bacterium]
MGLARWARGWLWVGSAVVLVGCSGGGAPVEAGPRPERPDEVQKVQTAGGEAVRLSDQEPRVRVWSARWGKAQLSYGESGRISGTMETVTGAFYENGEPASEFSAERAVADQSTARLVLEGRVVVVSQDPAGRLSCDTLTWDAEAGVLEARGNVRYETDRFVLGPFASMLGSPKLQRVGTPELFGSQDAKR